MPGATAKRSTLLDPTTLAEIRDLRLIARVLVEGFLAGAHASARPSAGLEWLLGFRVRAGTLDLDPCIPKAWRGFTIDFRHDTARYRIEVENPRGVNRGVTLLELDGVPVAGARIPLVADGASHRVRVVLG